MMELDLRLFYLINNLAGKNDVLDTVMTTVVSDYFVPVAASLLLVTLWFDGPGLRGREQNQRAVLHAAATQGLANLVVKLCNLVYFRPRPYATHPVNLLFYRPPDSAFPSNPAAVGFAFATAVWFYNRRAGAVMYVLAALFSFARIYCGVQYPLDVLAGALIGAGAAYLVVRKLGFVDSVVSCLIQTGRRLHLA